MRGRHFIVFPGEGQADPKSKHQTAFLRTHYMTNSCTHCCTLVLQLPHRFETVCVVALPELGQLGYELPGAFDGVWSPLVVPVYPHTH